MPMVSSSLNSLRSYVGGLTWAPLVNLSRTLVLGLLQRIEVGQIIVTDSDGAVFVCGLAWAKGARPKTELTVLRDTFWVRVLLFADMVRCIAQTPSLEALRRMVR